MTLSLLWATNTNYSTGSASGTPTKVNPSSAANGFIPGTIAAPQHVNYLFDLVGDELAKGVDGVNGGTYTLASNLIFTGAGEVRYAGIVRLTTGAFLNVDAGAEINITGDVDLAGEFRVLSTGSIVFRSSSDLLLETGSLMTLESGANIVTDGNITASGTVLLESGALLVLDGAQAFLDAADDLVISAQTRTAKFTMTPTAVEHVAGVPAWQQIGSPGTWVQVDVAAQRTILFPVTLPPGDDIVSVTFGVDGNSAGGGGHVTIPVLADRVTLRLVSVDTSGVVTTHATKADDSADATAYDTPHLVTMSSGTVTTGSMPQTIASGEVYYILVEGEVGAFAVANTTGLYLLQASHTNRSLTGSGSVSHYV